MKSARLLTLTVATLLVVASAAWAQDDLDGLTTRKPARRQAATEEENTDPARSGPVLGVGALYALDNFSNVGMDTTGSAGFNARVGYRHNRWVASEVEIGKYVQFNGDVSAFGPGGQGEVNGWAIGGNLRGYLLPGRVQPFLIGGINYLKMETTNSLNKSNPNKTDDGPGLRLGAGVDVYATPKIVVTSDVSYMLGLGDVKNYDMVLFSLGFAYRP